jgi:2-amino-4-hydroxy-6-hydroxymethyldihydropteridine diphosphokinase
MNIQAEIKLNSSFLLLGSNLGDRIQYLEEAIRMVKEMGSSIVAGSSVYETEPWGFVSGDYFLNMVVELRTGMSPEGILSMINIIEERLGRTRSFEKYQSRTIDLDILFYNDMIIAKPGLIIPHPLIPERRFVLVPMNEIAPGYNHPVLNKSVSLLLEECKDQSEVKKTGRIFFHE